MAGCCVHVTTVIRFFSHVIHQIDKFIPPAKHLNETLINFDNFQQPNRPKLMKNKRSKIVLF